MTTYITFENWIKVKIVKEKGLVKQESNQLSVIVACYNVAEYLRDCLDSLLAQTFKNFEVIMIDDHSDDDTSTIIDEYAQQYDNFKAVHNEQNFGPSASRNLGIELANGDWLAFVDGDDILPKRAYELMIGSLVKSGSQVVTGFVRRFDSGRDKPSYLHSKAIVDDYRHVTLADHSELLYDTTSWNKIYSLSLLRHNDIKFPIGQIYEDVSFTLDAFLHSTGIDILTDVVYNWRWRESSGKASFTQVKNELPKYLDRITSLNQIRSLLQDNNLWDGKVKRQVEYKLLDMDIPLFMDDIADADESFVYQFQEETVKFFRDWHLLDTPIIRTLSVKKQYQYYALLNGDFELLKRISANAFSGRVAKLEQKSLNLPEFHAPKMLKSRISKVRCLDGVILFNGSLRVGSTAPRHFPYNPEVVSVYLENIITGKCISLSTFSRQFTVFNLHLRRMIIPSSKFSLALNVEDVIRELGEGTYKVRIDYRENKTAKLLTTYLGQPMKGAGKITPFEVHDNKLSVVYGYNTNWEMTIKVQPTAELAAGSESDPTVLTTVRLDRSSVLVIGGTTPESDLSLSINNATISQSKTSDGLFEFRVKAEFLERFLNHSIKLTFVNSESEPV
ncbi:glycosyltransferase family 2 protein [Lactiplantibacillus argentoratensis]|uniref:glycosyltransferase family 2 protein n=1 Tax=Lactiplantibacillus argentoratensis TaxID=271881 RepID=UPI001D08D840|nr:glycosyltransferase family 2 protein [Lactiplantibacillus argentoratensis]MCB7462951.1 glycosyltransferase family 2 protein [Lactiplantibacillus argentoratensis]